MNKWTKISLAFNVILLIGLIFMAVWVAKFEYNWNQNLDTQTSQYPTVNDLVIDLQNRGIIGDKLLEGHEFKPYSNEQMEEFQKYIQEKYPDSIKN